MEQLVTTLLTELNGQEGQLTTRQMLASAAAILMAHLQADLIIGYELIPETGGVPKSQPIFDGHWLDLPAARPVLEANWNQGSFSDLIRHWRPHYETDARGWSEGYCSNGDDDFARIMAREGVRTFVFLPIHLQQTRLAAVLLGFRRSRPFPEPTRQILNACGGLIGACLLPFRPPLTDVHNLKKRRAIAHTLYGKVAVIFKGQIDALEMEMAQTLGKHLPPTVADHLQAARHTVFEGMRSLVIEASGDLLVDLQTMSLAKALQTAVAALKRAWPPGQRITIDLYPVPAIIERQSLLLRQILYTMVLEAVGNAIKHGGPAPYINIDLNWADNRVYVQVIDHGQGFDRQTKPFSEFGLGFWQAYVPQQLGGTFAVSSQPGYGTVVTAVIPVIPARSEHHDQ